jgi:hypothetical protein
MPASHLGVGAVEGVLVGAGVGLKTHAKPDPAAVIPSQHNATVFAA